MSSKEWNQRAGLLLSSDDAAPAVLHRIATTAMGKDWLAWQDAQTCWRTLSMELSIPEGAISLQSREKLNAMRFLASTSLAFNDQDAFENVVIAFNDFIPTWGLLEGFSPEHGCWAVEQVMAINEWDEPGRDVCYYVAGVLGTDGWVIAPDHLAFAQPELDEYCLQAMNKTELSGLKRDIRAGMKSEPRDDDADAASVAVRRALGVAAYLESKRAAEARQISRLG